MKAIIPVAGIGTRLRPHTHTNPKVLLPVAGKPIIGHILDEMVKIGIEEITFIVGYRGRQVRDYVEANYRFRTNFVDQEEMLGLGHAIWLARPFHDTSEPALIILGDTIFKADLDPVVRGSVSMLGVKEVADPRRFGVIEKNEAGRIVRLVEKPEVPPSRLAIVGIYFLRDMPLLFRCLEHNITRGVRTKNEFQLTDALQRMLEQGEPMGYFAVAGWHDCGKRETLLETNRALLQMGIGATHGRVGKDSLVIPPVAIAEDVRIERSIVGPNVSISAGSAVTDSIVRDAIISSNSIVENCLLSGSVISDNARVTGRFSSLNVGDSSEIDFS